MNTTLRLVTIAASLVCVTAVFAQTSKEAPTRISKPPAGPIKPKPAPATRPPEKAEAPAASPTVRAARVELSDEPVQLDSVGLTFYAPHKAEVFSTSVGNEAVLAVAPKEGGWKIDVRTPRTTNPDLTAKDAGEAVKFQLLKSTGVQDGAPDRVKSLGKVIDETDRLVTDASRPDLVAHRFYVSLPAIGGGPDNIKGYTVWRLDRKTFCAFELTTTADKFEAARSIYETVVASARFTDRAEITAARAAAVAAGGSLLSNLSPEDFEAILKTRNDRWERLFVPSPSGAQMDDDEIAYRRVRCRIGVRGELDVKKPQSSWNTTDKQRGYVLQIDSRARVGKGTLDSQAIYFLSADRNEEAWTIRNAVREGENTATSTETGARTGKSMIVQTETTGQPTKTTKPVFETDGYVSQLESLLLPQILVRAKLPGEFAFYAYQPRDAQIRLRRDAIEQPKDRPGLWRLTTRQSERSDKAQVSLYNDAGVLIRTEIPDGSVWEPIDFESLVRLWRSKGLPME